MKMYCLILVSIICFFSVHQIKAQSTLSEDILSTWDKHVEMNYLLMKALKPEYLRDTTTSGGRNIADQFAHLHNVRMSWLNELMAMDSNIVDVEIDSIESLDYAKLRNSLKSSDRLVRALLEMGLKEEETGWPMSPVRFMGYLISHESHTRGRFYWR